MMKILIVDSDADSRTAFASVLRAAGMEVILAASETEAMLSLQSGLPDVLICSTKVREPQMSSPIRIQRYAASGYELMRKIIHMGEASGQVIPCIALLNVDEDIDREQSLMTGCQFYVTRRTNPERLLTLVNCFQKWLSKIQAEDRLNCRQDTVPLSLAGQTLADTFVA